MYKTTSSSPARDNLAVITQLASGGIGEHTQIAGGLADSQGNEVSAEELQQLVGCEKEPTISFLQNMSTIGMGGIGTVFSAQDPALHREIAIKILRPAYRNQLKHVGSFIREARITAQIDHPNVIPVHRLGVFDDAGIYFTMKRVRGVTLAQILRKLKEGDQTMLATYTRQRLLEIFVSICNGVAFAHSKGIIHRDLKPANIMVGDYGEVFIADWGLALYREENDIELHAGKIKLGKLPEEDNPNSGEGGHKISGTPAFMAPEQVTGKEDELDSQIDVYALGTILYSILTWEQSPYDGVSTVTQLMQRVMSRKFLRPRRRAPKRKIPYELEAITLKAMHANKKDRYESVKALLADVRNYLAKYPVSAYSPLPLYRLYKLIRRRPLVPVTLLAALLTLGVWNGSNALHNYVQSKSMLSVVNSSLEDCEKSRRIAVASHSKLNELYAQTGKTETLGGAVSLKSRYLRSYNEFIIACNNTWEHLNNLRLLKMDDRELAPLFSKLLNIQLKFGLAIDNQDWLSQVAERIRMLPDKLVEQIYVCEPELERQMQLLTQNQGELKIDLCGVNAQLSGLNIKNTLQGTAVAAAENQPETFIKLQPSPAVNKLRAGVYLITLHMRDGREFRFPVLVERDNLETVTLTPPGEVPEGMVYIPEGNFIFGDRTFDDQFVRTRLPAFFISKYEVTIGEYLKFWKSIQQPDLREQYRAYVENHTSPGRRLMPLWDDEGRISEPYVERMPVIGITYEAMEAYCKYMSQKTELRYRLPTALEWEKAARGVDGREYVWGNDYRSNFAHVNQRGQTARGNMPVPVGSFAKDVSVYGVYDLTGNARELVTNPNGWLYYTGKGSSFNFSQRFARAAAHAYTSNLSDVGFRCVVEIRK